MLCKASEEESLSNVMRDFKKFTSKQIIKTIIEYPESRREWMLSYFKHVYSNSFIRQKINYIHRNPVVEKIVSESEDYVFSSARNYAELESEIEIIRLDLF